MKIINKLYWLPLFRRLTVRKLLNSMVQWYELKTKKIIVHSFPSMAIIDPTNFCNLRCRLCPTGQGKHKSQGYIEKELYIKILDEIGPYLYEICLYNWGEPFLHKDIFSLITIANRRNIATTISSNMNYFPEGFEEKLIESRLERLIVPIYGATQESHSRYSVGGSIEKIRSNIKRIVECKKANGAQLPFVKIKFLINKFNENEIEMARDLARELDVELLLGQFMFNAKDTRLREKWETTKDDYKLYDENKGLDKRYRRYHCVWLWKNTVINFNGIVNPCCSWFDNGNMDFGDSTKNSFKEIWNNRYFQASRKALKGIKCDLHTICTGCLGIPPSMNESGDQ